LKDKGTQSLNNLMSVKNNMTLVSQRKITWIFQDSILLSWNHVLPKVTALSHF
jgi:hypothetical protein